MLNIEENWKVKKLPDGLYVWKPIFFTANV